jgi:hypothetical protein
VRISWIVAGCVVAGCVKAGQYQPGVSPCLLKQTRGSLYASVGASMLEGLDEMMAVDRLKLPAPRHSLVCANGTTQLAAS